ncbi:MAG TPA: outer membrane beta-barrel protein [Gemmatimonadales bacterium]|nr:outer membrane beta-barrel protein [Gemmatimonadales bacterium]
MTFRVLLLVTGAAVAGVLPAAAQKRGSFELGAFAAYFNADNSLAVDNPFGFGGRAGVNLFPYLAVEVDYASASNNGAKYSPLHVYAVYEVPPVSRAELFFGIGYVKNKYTGSYEAEDSGVGGIVGLRHRINKTVAWRLDGRADFMPNAANKSYLVSYNGNWGIGLGLSALLKR